MKQILVAVLVTLSLWTTAFAAEPDPIVLGSCHVTAAVGWTNPADCSQPVSQADAGWASTDVPLAAPTQYFEYTFDAAAGSYHIWVRMKALNNSKWNDSIWVQFNDAVNGSGQAINRIGTAKALAVNLATDATAGSLNAWGWQDGAYWLSQATTFTYATSGPHTIRVQTREDGVFVDEIILSRATYLKTSPGKFTNDLVRLTPTSTTSTAAAPTAAASPMPALAATNVATSSGVSWSASANATSYDVFFGPSNPPISVSAGQATTSYQPAATLTAGTTYFWRIDARGTGGTTPGPVWSFTTAAPVPPPPPPPGVASVIAPGPSASNVVTTAGLSWVAATNATSYDVSFGTSNPPPIAAPNYAATTYQPPTALTASTTYFWRVDARGPGGVTAGQVSSFTTAAPAPPPTPAPSVPSLIAPTAAASNVATTAAVSWAAATNATSYDVSFGTSNPPPVAAPNYTATTYQPPTALSASTTYYWRIDARGTGGVTAGPVWSFTTAAPATPAPAVVTAPTPATVATNVAITSGVSWAASANATSYDVFFGTNNPPPAVSSSQPGTTYQPAASLTASTTYFWRVDARGAGGVTSGTVWSFTTAAPAPPPTPAPGVPVAVAPASGGTNIATTTALSWSAASDATSYDVSFGTSNPPPMASANQTATTFQPPAALTANGTYYWRVDAHGPGGATAGQVWSFTTAAPAAPAPGAPSAPMPANGSATALVGAALNWAAAANATTYDVYFGTTAAPPLVSSGQTNTAFQPSGTAQSTTYYWKVVAIGAGGRTTGPVWTFSTAAPAPPPPPPPPAGDAASSNNTPLKRLRVFNWNLAQGYNQISNTNDYNLQLDMIASINPDVITLQEVSFSDADMMTLYINGLAQRTGRAWRGYYQRGNAEVTPTTDNIGSAILTWLPVDEQSQHLFIDDPSHPFEAVEIQVTVNGTPVHISTAHLYAWDTAVRANQLNALQTWLAPQGIHRIVSGDFNANPVDTTTWIPSWASEYKDAWVTATSWIQPTNDGGYTFDKRTATGKPERIDYQWIKGLTVSEMFVMKTRRSDHHALVADYLVP